MPEVKPGNARVARPPACHSSMGIASLACSILFILYIGVMSLLLRLFPEKPPLSLLTLVGNALFFGLFIGVGLGIGGLLQRRTKMAFSITGLVLNLILLTAVLYMNYRFG